MTGLEAGLFLDKAYSAGNLPSNTRLAGKLALNGRNIAHNRGMAAIEGAAYVLQGQGSMLAGQVKNGIAALHAFLFAGF